MTNEEKLLRILEIACKNGYLGYESFQISLPPKYISAKNIGVDSDSCFVNQSGFYNQVSLNDLVLNFKEGETSFLNALCYEVFSKGDEFIQSNMDMYFWGKKDYVAVGTIRQIWCGIETKDRLAFLFRIFAPIM